MCLEANYKSRRSEIGQLPLKNDWAMNSRIQISRMKEKSLLGTQIKSQN